MRVMGRRCCGNGSSGEGGVGRREGEPKGGGPNDFLAGGPEFEVTPLPTVVSRSRQVKVGQTC